MLMPLLPAIHKSRLQIINIGADKQEIVIRLVMTTLTAQCPNCQQWSQSIHSHYVRRLADLPWGGVPVRIELKVRRFRCSTPNCQHRYFTERVALERRAHNHKLRVIPVLLPGTKKPKIDEMSPFLRQLTWVDFRKGLNDPVALKRFVAGIKGQPPGAP